MNEETLALLMQAIDPARDLTDETLAELFTHEHLMERVDARIAEDAPTPIKVPRIPVWQRVPTLIGTSAAAVVLVITGVVTLTGTPATFAIAGVAIPVHTMTNTLAPRLPVSGGLYAAQGVVTVTGAPMEVPVCVPSRIRETMNLNPIHAVMEIGYRGTLVVQNLGDTCYMRKTYVGLEAVTGPKRRIVASSVTPSIAFGSVFVVRRGEALNTSITVFSTSRPGAIGCRPSFAEGVVVTSLYQGWPADYFRLPSQLPVYACQNWFALAGGPLVRQGG
jgi:hypothetical protein